MDQLRECEPKDRTRDESEGHHQHRCHCGDLRLCRRGVDDHEQTKQQSHGDEDEMNPADGPQEGRNQSQRWSIWQTCHPFIIAHGLTRFSNLRLGFGARFVFCSTRSKRLIIERGERRCGCGFTRWRVDLIGAVEVRERSDGRTFRPIARQVGEVDIAGWLRRRTRRSSHGGLRGSARLGHRWRVLV